VTIKGARDLDHAPIITRFRSSSKQVADTHVSIKVEGNQMARSHPSRTDRWNEDFEITVDKANEIEIVIYDKQVSEPHAVPIGLLWIKINDIVDAIRRQKVGQDAQGGGWVTAAGAMHGDGPQNAQQYGQRGFGDVNAPIGFQDGGVPLGQGAREMDGIDALFAVQPAGELALHLNFGASALSSSLQCPDFEQ
jgi:hypothetical protein